MSINATSLPPALQFLQPGQSAQNAQKPTAPAVPHTAGTDSDGDNDGSGGGSVNITPPVNIKA